VIFGPGTLRYAHSNEEQISLDEIAEAGCVLTDFAAQWCQ
jgi:acetylornithine deacetylase/succinyl-diaminopimelate desuccinylase-like protein